MRIVLSMALLLSLSGIASAEQFHNVPVVDVQCSQKAKGDPDKHTRGCALACKGSGFGLVTADGRFLKFDKKGNDEFAELLKSSKKQDHIRADVDGKVSGDTVQVSSVKLD